MKILIEREKKDISIEFQGTCQELLVKLNINPETVLVVKGDELIQDDDFLNDEDSVKIISVVSGG